MRHLLIQKQKAEPIRYNGDCAGTNTGYCTGRCGHNTGGCVISIAKNKG